MKKILRRKIYFDMDGTIADLYGVPNWLENLRAEKSEPYAIAKPLYDTEKLNALLETLKIFGYDIGIITWGSMNASDNYNVEVRTVKQGWIRTYFPAIKEFHFQPYGRPKHKASYQNIKINKDILIDDNAEVRAMWVKKGGVAIAPTENLFNDLAKLIA